MCYRLDAVCDGLWGAVFLWQYLTNQGGRYAELALCLVKYHTVKEYGIREVHAITGREGPEEELRIAVLFL
jgi:hypothetical protein